MFGGVKWSDFLPEKRRENRIKQYLGEFQIFEITTKLVIQRKKGAPVDFVCLATKK